MEPKEILEIYRDNIILSRIVMNKALFLLLVIMLAITCFSIGCTPSSVTVIANTTESGNKDRIPMVRLVYGLDFPKDITDQGKQITVENTIAIIKKRLTDFGIDNPIVQENEKYRIKILLSSKFNIEKAKDCIENNDGLPVNLILPPFDQNVE